MSGVTTGNQLTFERFAPDDVRQFFETAEIEFGTQMSRINTMLIVSKEAAVEARDIFQEIVQNWPADEVKHD